MRLDSKSIFGSHGSLVATARTSSLPSADLSVASENLQPRVLFLVDQLTELGGGERTVLLLFDKLKARGYSPQIITFREDPAPCIESFGGDIQVLAMRSCFSLDGLRTAIRLARSIKKNRIQIVHTFFETSDIFGAMVARLSGVKVVLSSRRDMGILRSFRHRIAYRLLASAYTKVLAVSDSVRNWHLSADKLTPENIITIRNGLDLERFNVPIQTAQVRDSLGLAKDRTLITTVANINVWKGLDTFVETAALVCRQNPNIEFCIAGEFTDAKHAEGLQQRAHELGIIDRFHFLGRIEEVSQLLAATNIFCLLSQSEGFPNVVLEAMAAGLPVIATAVGGTPEAITDGENGMLVNVNDPAAAASRICALISNPTVAHRMGEAAREHVRNNFSLERMLNQYIELYMSLVTPEVSGGAR